MIARGTRERSYLELGDVILSPPWPLPLQGGGAGKGQGKPNKTAAMPLRQSTLFGNLEPMRAFLRRLLGVERPPSPKVLELWQRVEDVEAALVSMQRRITDQLEAMNIRITNKLRLQRTVEDAPSEENEGAAAPGADSRRTAQGTAHLSRRFR